MSGTREVCGNTLCGGACWSNGDSCGKPMRCPECAGDQWRSDEVMECYECAKCGRRDVPWRADA